MIIKSVDEKHEFDQSTIISVFHSHSSSDMPVNLKDLRNGDMQWKEGKTTQETSIKCVIQGLIGQILLNTSYVYREKNKSSLTRRTVWMLKWLVMRLISFLVTTPR